jgi:hypothetical protein
MSDFRENSGTIVLLWQDLQFPFSLWFQGAIYLWVTEVQLTMRQALLDKELREL